MSLYNKLLNIVYLEILLTIFEIIKEKRFKLGALGESAALPGHTKRINALLLLMHKNNPHLISASDDNSIKIWK